jgi:dTDP-4-dehydrorhamnose 3,5-epimerase
MLFKETQLKGVLLVELEPKKDERGFFARTWCRETFLERGLNPDMVQCSISFNKLKGTLRGMHFQAYPHAEAKLVRCTRGAVYDVVVDIRRDSVTFGNWVAFDLSAANHLALYVPEGCAHGFQTLEDDTEMLYQISESYHPELQGGFRWNDTFFRFEWPLPNPIVSNRDKSYADFAANR